MFANDRHTDTEAQARASARALGSVKGIKDLRKRFRADADPVILNRDGHLIAVASGANLDPARVANLADGLFGVGNQVQDCLLYTSDAADE